MVQQIRDVLSEYEARGGRVQMSMYEGSGHFPPLDARERWQAEFFAFLQLFAASGAHAAFEAEAFALVGDEVSGGLPLGPAPALAVPVSLAVAPGPGGVGFRLSWDGVAGVVYRVQFSTDLIAWDDASGDLPGAPPLLHFDHLPGVPQGFYRIVQVE